MNLRALVCSSVCQRITTARLCCDGDQRFHGLGGLLRCGSSDCGNGLDCCSATPICSIIDSAFSLVACRHLCSWLVKLRLVALAVGLLAAGADGRL